MLAALGKSHKPIQKQMEALALLVLLVKATHAFVQSLRVLALVLVMSVVPLSASAVVFVALALATNNTY